MIVTSNQVIWGTKFSPESENKTKRPNPVFKSFFFPRSQEVGISNFTMCHERSRILLPLRHKGLITLLISLLAFIDRG